MRLYRFTSLLAGVVVFVTVLTVFVMAEDSLIRAVPALGGLGRVLFFVLAAIAVVPSALAHRMAGGKRLKVLEAEERTRDDASF